MLSGVGFPELILIFVIGLLILGPERLPRVASQLGRWIGRARRTANQLRFQLEREIALADIDKKTPKNPPEKPGTRTDGTSDSGGDASPGQSGADGAGGANTSGGGDGAEGHASTGSGSAAGSTGAGPASGSTGSGSAEGSTGSGSAAAGRAGAAPGGQTGSTGDPEAGQADGESTRKP